MEPEKTLGYFGGGNPVPDEDFITAISTNLTPDKTYGLGNWSEQEFHAAVKTGNKKDGSILKHQMPRFSQLSDEEVSAIWAYLQTIPALENNPVAMQLRGMNMLFEGLKEKGSLMVVPSSALESMNLGAIGGLTALAQHAETNNK